MSELGIPLLAMLTEQPFNRQGSRLVCSLCYFLHHHIIPGCAASFFYTILTIRLLLMHCNEEVAWNSYKHITRVCSIINIDQCLVDMLWVPLIYFGGVGQADIESEKGYINSHGTKQEFPWSALFFADDEVLSGESREVEAELERWKKAL